MSRHKVPLRDGIAAASAYYDTELAFGSEDPANPAITRRVITLMRPADY